MPDKQYDNQLGEIKASIEVYDYAPFARGRNWWRLMLMILFAVMALALFTEGWTAVSPIVAIVVFSWVYYKTHMSGGTQLIPFIIGSKGLLADGRFYIKDEISSFFIIPHGDYFVLGLDIAGQKKQLKQIYLPMMTDISALREVLMEDVTENKLPRENIITRMLRLIKL